MAKKNSKKTSLNKNKKLAKTKIKENKKKFLKPKTIEKKPNKAKTKVATKSKKTATKTQKKDLKKTSAKKIQPPKKPKELKKIISKKTENIINKKNKLPKLNKIKPSTKFKEEKIKKSEKTTAEQSPKIETQTHQNKRQKNTKKIDPKANQPFKVNEYAVYPAHGVGKIVEIQTTKIMNQDYSCYLIFFEKEKLTIKVPIANSQRIGLRRIVSKSQMEEVLGILRSGIKKLKGMWSRRAQEYETKINSGDIFMLAEVLRDLTRDIEDSERSYSERIIYETAIFRLASEYAIIFNTDIESAKEKIINIAKDKINSDAKSSSKDDFDDFDFEDRKSKIDGDEDEDENEEDEDEEEDDDFNYDFNEIDEDDDEDDKPKKKRK